MQHQVSSKGTSLAAIVILVLHTQALHMILCHGRDAVTGSNVASSGTEASPWLSPGQPGSHAVSCVPLQLEAGHTVSLHLRPRHIGSDALLYDVIALFSEVQARMGQRRRLAGSPAGGHVSGPAATGPLPMALAQKTNNRTGIGERAHGSARHEALVRQLDLALAVIRQSSVGLLLVRAHPPASSLLWHINYYAWSSGDTAALPGSS